MKKFSKQINKIIENKFTTLEEKGIDKLVDTIYKEMIKEKEKGNLLRAIIFNQLIDSIEEYDNLGTFLDYH